MVRAMKGLVCALAVGLGATAQKLPPTKSAQTERPPAIRATSRLVEVSVVVHDKRGAPVAGLKRDDFVLLEDGVEQQIAVFNEDEATLPANTAPLPPNAFSNRLSPGRAPGSVSVILLDGLNTRWEDQAYVRMKIIKFLGQVRADDRVALYALGSRMRVLHDFTSDTAALLAALERYRARHSGELDASEPPPSDTGNAELDAWLNEANQSQASFFTRHRALRTFQAFEAIALHLAGVPGRKNLVWVSSSFPLFVPDARGFLDQNFSPEAEKVARTLNNANIAIYPVDARGLMPLTFSPGIPGRPGAPILISGPPLSSHDTMVLLAQRTGGKAYYNRNDIDGAVRAAIEDSRITYTLAYYPTHGQWDGRFRKIQVRVKREGMRIRHRSGYFALADPRLEPAEPAALMRAAAADLLDRTALGLTATVERMSMPDGESLKVRLDFVAGEIALTGDAGRFKGRVDVWLVQLDSTGEKARARTHSIPLDLDARAYAEFNRTAQNLTRLVPLEPDAGELRIVARDFVSGAMGTLRIPLSRITAQAQ